MLKGDGVYISIYGHARLWVAMEDVGGRAIERGACPPPPSIMADHKTELSQRRMQYARAFIAGSTTHAISILIVPTLAPRFCRVTLRCQQFDICGTDLRGCTIGTFDCANLWPNSLIRF